LAAEVSDEVPDLLLALVDDLALGCLVNGIGNPLTELLELSTQGFQQSFGSDGG
jgi:hypothetical protein